MKFDNVDKILGAGLVAALLIFFIGQFACLLCDKPPLPMEIANTIAVGLIGFMSKLVLQNGRDDPHDNHKPPTTNEQRDCASQKHSEAVSLSERKPEK